MVRHTFFQNANKTQRPEESSDVEGGQEGNADDMVASAENMEENAITGPQNDEDEQAKEDTEHEQEEMEVSEE